jgi:rod shape-determining protein MreC
MRNLFRFLYSYHLVFLFIILELTALLLIAGKNDFQRAALQQAAHSVTARYYTRLNKFREYLTLRDTNQKLSEENTRLLERLANLSVLHNTDSLQWQNDTTFRQSYACIPARVINASVNKQRNYLTLDKGSDEGIAPEMAVIGSQGVVGIVVGTSRHYSTVMPLLHRDMNLSVRFLKNQYFGALSWPGTHTRTGLLHDIPLHVPVAVGDTIVTSRFSTMFPEGIPVGYVASFDSTDGNFYTIRVHLATEFQQIHHVSVVNDLTKQERDSLELNLPKP